MWFALRNHPLAHRCRRAGAVHSIISGHFDKPASALPKLDRVDRVPVLTNKPSPPAMRGRAKALIGFLVLFAIILWIAAMWVVHFPHTITQIIHSLALR